MSLVIIISDLKVGGTQKVLRELISYLETKKDKISLIVLGSCDNNISKKIKFIKLNLQKENKSFIQSIFHNLLIIKKLRKTIKNNNSDRVLSLIYETNIISILSNIGLNKKIYVSERNNPFFQKGKIIWRILRYLLYRLADKIIVNNYFAYDYLVRFIDKKKIFVINNSIKFKNRQIVKKKKIILTVASLTNQKSIDLLIKAFKIFHNKHQDWILKIIGTGPLEQDLKKLCKKINIHKNVIFQGVKMDLNKDYQECEIFCLPSKYEGMSNAMLEAMMLNDKVLVSDNAIHDKENLNAYLYQFKYGDISDLVNKLNYLSEISLKETNFSHFAKNNLSKETIGQLWRVILKD